MADITAPRQDKRQTGDILSVPVGAGIKVYAGGLLTFAAGYAVAANAAQAVAGVAIETVDNTAGIDGAKNVRVSRNGIFSFRAAGLTAADAGKEVVVGADDDLVALVTAGAGKIPIGRIARVVSATECLVQLNVNGTATTA